MIILGLLCSYHLTLKSQIPYPDLVVSQLYLFGTTNEYQSPTGIISPKTTPIPIPYFGITDYANVTFKAGTQIQLNPGFYAGGFNSNGLFHAYVEKPDFEVVLFEPTDHPGYVGKYEKFEIGIKPPQNILDVSNVYICV